MDFETDGASKHWEDRFGYVTECHAKSCNGGMGTPIAIGELGGFYDENISALDVEWQKWSARYVAKRQFGLFYFALNPSVAATTHAQCTPTPCPSLSVGALLSVSLCAEKC